MPARFDWPSFDRCPLVGILRGFPLSQTLSAVEAVYQGGLTTVEVTLNSPDALSQIQELQAKFEGQINVGAGTVCTALEATQAIEHGASFLVTPTVSEEVIQIAQQADVPAFVGALTPTEILRAWDLGATFVKVFPADAFGPGYLKSVRGPLSQIRLMPTGGITASNLPDYQRAGATAFGIGSPLFNKERVEAKDWPWLTTQAQGFLEAFQSGQEVSPQQQA